MNRRTLLKSVAASGLSLAAEVTAGQEAPAQRVLVLGGTGRTGVHLVQGLLAKGQRVRVLTRSVERARLVFDNRVDIVTGDVLEAATLSPALQGVSGVISAIGSGGGRDRSYLPEQADYHGMRNLVTAAKGQSLEHVVLVSAMGVTQPDHPLNRVAGNVLLWKALGENTLRFSGINYTIVRPGALLDGAGGQHALRVGQGDSFRDWQRPVADLPAIDRADLAAICIHALGRQALFARTFEVWREVTASATDWNRLFAQLRPDSTARLAR